MIDLMVAFIHAGPAKGLSVALLGGAGGETVRTSTIKTRIITSLRNLNLTGSEQVLVSVASPVIQPVIPELLRGSKYAIAHMWQRRPACETEARKCEQLQ
jgi:hypothetical protein